MEQENSLPETSLQQDQQLYQAIADQDLSHIEGTKMMIEQSSSEDSFDINFSKLLKACQFKKASSLLEAEISSKQASLGEFNVQLVPLLNQMAEVQIALAKYTEARIACQKSERILEAYLEDPSIHKLIAHTFQIRSVLLREGQDYKEALGFISRSLELSSPDRLENIEIYRIKALVLCDLQQYKEALAEIQKCIEIIENSKNTIVDNILKARVYNALGEIHLTLRDWKKASGAFETAMEICGKYDLSFHIEMAKACEGFARCLIETKNISPAILHLAELALKVYEQFFGEDRHPARIPSFLLLIRYFKIQKKLAKVTEYVSQALEEGESFYGDDCEKMREISLSIAKACGNHQLKRDLVSPILDKTSIGRNGRELLNLYLQKFDSCLLCEEYQIFGSLLQKALNTISNAFGERSVEMVKIYERVVIFYQAMKQMGKVIYFLERCLGIYKENLGENHIEVAKAYLMFSGVYSTQKKFAQAIVYLEQALKIQAGFYGEEHPIAIETHILLANAYGFNEETAKSMKTHLKILRIQERIGDEKVYETYESMGMLYSKLNDAESSGNYFRKSFQMARVKLGKDDERALDTKEFCEFNAEEKDMLDNTQQLY